MMTNRFQHPAIVIVLGLGMTGCASTREAGDLQVLKDPGFEVGAFASSPVEGWYSDDAADGRLRASADAGIHVQGSRSLAIDVVEPRPAGAGIAFVAQAVRLDDTMPDRDLDLRLSLRGAALPSVHIDLYVWDAEQRAQTIASQEVTLTDEEWHRTVLPFHVPATHRSFGIWIYIKGGKGSRLWLDDASVTRQA